MPAIKRWTKEAHGIGYDPIGLAFVEETQTLKWSRSYYFVDENGDRIEGGGIVVPELDLSVRGEMPWANVPQKVKDALTIIDTYTKDQIRQKEGLDGS